MKFLIALTLLAMPTFALSADEKAKEAGLEEHIKMHETMAKAHEDAAECLEDKRPMEECRAAFHKTCSDAKAPGMCGHMGMKGMKGMKGKGNP